MKLKSLFPKVLFSVLFLFLLLNCKKEHPKTLPVVTTSSSSSVTNITGNSVTVSGEISSDGGESVTARGFCWSSTNTTPTISDSKSADGTGSGKFTSTLTGLLPGTTYNIRSYAINNIGTVYGNVVTFTTNAILPTLTTTDISGITTSSATAGGNITADGGGAITARGVCWNTASSPTISNSRTSDGTGIGVFTSAISGLTVNTTYYLRGYATNSAGTAYGNEITATTLNQGIKSIVSDSILSVISKLGMPIFNGNTPPNLVNFYKISPEILKNTNVPGDLIGDIYNDVNIHFYNQDNTNLTVKLDTKQGSSTSSSYGAFISGSGNGFSAFIKLITIDSDGKQTDAIEIFSGTMTSSGIKDLYLAYFMTNRHENTNYIPNGKGRVFFDSDGMSEIILSLSSQAINNSKSAIISSRKNMLEK